MKIIVSKIPDEGIDVHSTESADTLGIAPSDLALDGNVHIEAMISREGRIFFVDGTIRTTLHLTCSRCAGEFSYPVDTFFHCHEEPVRKGGSEIEAALHKMDMDIDHYSGDEVELNNLFREQLILAIPMHPLCMPDCLGLCPKCGQNLNVKRCDCREEEVSSQFSVIKKLFE